MAPTKVTQLYKLPAVILTMSGSTALTVYRCSHCSIVFGQEETICGPKFCPACGAIVGREGVTIQHIITAGNNLAHHYRELLEIVFPESKDKAVPSIESWKKVVTE